MKHRLLIFALLAMVATGVVGSPVTAQDTKQKTGKAELTRKEKKELKKAEKKEHKLEKAEQKKEKRFVKPTEPTKAEKRKQRRELKRKQRQERKQLKKQQKINKHKKVGVIVVGTPSLVPAPPPPVVIKKKRDITYPHTQMKPRYRVDVLAPMYLDELVKDGSITYKDRMPEKAVAGITFYEGVSIAADSLKRAGFNIDIYVHDVASAAEAADVLIRKGNLDSADLILGAVQPHDVAILADYAHRKHVNFVSVLTPSDGGVKDNEYFTLVQPTLQAHCEWIDSEITKKFPGVKPVLLFRTTALGDSLAYRYMIDTVAKVRFRPLVCNVLPHKADMMYLFDTGRTNVVVMPILDFVYADSLLRKLSLDFPGMHFEVYGMPSWTSIPDLKSPTALPGLSVNVTTPFSINMADGTARYVAATFKKDYGGKATEMAYRGYETMYWYAHLLKNYGTIFNTKYADNTAAPFTKFDIKTAWDKNLNLLFNENKHIFLTRYEGGGAKVME